MSKSSDQQQMKIQLDIEESRIISELNNFLEIYKRAIKGNDKTFENKTLNELIVLEIEENLEPSQNNAYHLSITNSHIHRIDSELNTETIELDPEGDSLYGQAIVSYKNHFYSIGGSHLSGQTSQLVSVYDLNGQLKQSEALLKHERKFAACIEINKKIFIVGGQNSSGQGINLIEVIDLKTFQNISQANLSISKSFPSVCNFNGFLYVANSENNIIEKFDPENLAANKKIPIENVYFIAEVDKYLVAFSENNYAFLDINDRVVKNVKKNFRVIQWAQSGCGVNENEVFIKDYFSGKIEKISLDLP